MLVVKPTPRRLTTRILSYSFHNYPLGKVLPVGNLGKFILGKNNIKFQLFKLLKIYHIDVYINVGQSC